MFIPPTLAQVHVPDSVNLAEANHDLIPPVAEWIRQNSGFETIQDAMKYMLFSNFQAPVQDGKEFTMVHWITGGLMNRSARGPHKEAQVMLINKMPAPDDVSMGEVFYGSAGKLLREIASELGMDISDWYATNVVRFIPPGNDKTLKKPHLDACRWLLMQEIALIRPKYLLLLGADAVKSVCGRRMKLTSMRSHYYSFPDVAQLGVEPKTLDEQSLLSTEYGMRVMATLNPSAVLMEGGYREGFARDLELFRDWTRNRPLAPTDLSDRDYRYVYKRADLRRTTDEVKAKGIREISIDCEWCGSDYRSGVLRTVQFAWADKTACVIVLANQEGQPHLESAGLMQELAEFINVYRPGIIGHSLRADGRWLEHRGIHVMRLMSLDTMLLDHALNENAEHGLDACATRYTDMGRYDVPMYKWMATNGITQKFIKLHGFRGIPDEMLLPYAACDADCTFRIAKVLRARLALPENAGPRYCYEKVILPTNLPIHEIEMTGVLVDADRMEALTHRFAAKKIDLLGKIQLQLNMPSFNPRSTPQMQGLLFGKKEAGGFELVPYKTTGKPAKMWEELSDRELLRCSPSTDMETLESLADQNPVCSMLRDFKIIDQITKTFLREAEVDDETQEEVYTGGLMYELDDDGRIRTTISQMSETGRWKSSRPNCFPDWVEALTDRGWVPWPEVKDTDLLGQYRVATGEITFKKPTTLVSYDSTSPLIRIHNLYCDMITTADHRYYVQNRFSNKWSVYTAKNYPNEGKQPRAGFYKGGVVTLSVKQLSFIGVLLGGCELNPATVSVAVPNKLAEQFELLLGELGLTHGKMASVTRDCVLFDIMLKDIEVWCPQRYFKMGPWILELEKHTLLQLFDFLYENIFTRTKSDRTRVLPWNEKETNFDWWQILATLCNTTSYAFLHPDSYKPERELHFNRRESTLAYRLKREPVAYSGKVYCATMPMDTVIVRNKGFVSIVANCQNFPKKQDKAIKRIMGEIDTIRSCFVAKPGHILIEADFKSAEIYTLGFLANCARLLKDANGDLHARGAVSRFGAPAWPGYVSGAPPPEEWLEENKAIRVASKTVVFG